MPKMSKLTQLEFTVDEEGTLSAATATFSDTFVDGEDRYPIGTHRVDFSRAQDEAEFPSVVRGLIGEILPAQAKAQAQALADARQALQNLADAEAAAANLQSRFDATTGMLDQVSRERDAIRTDQEAMVNGFQELKSRSDVQANQLEQANTRVAELEAQLVQARAAPAEQA